MPQRPLRPNHSVRLPKRVVFFDTETIPEPIPGRPGVSAHCLHLGFAIYGEIINGQLTNRQDYLFTNYREFWSWVFQFASPRHGLILLAHNLQFDLRVCGFEVLTEDATLQLDIPKQRKGKPKNGKPSKPPHCICCFGSPPAMVALRHRHSNGRILALDTLNYWPMRLSDLGDLIDLPKLEMPAFNAPDNEWKTYCQRDVEIIMYAFTKYIRFIADNKHGMFSNTIAGQSMQSFRHGRMPVKVWQHDNMPVKALERQAYAGGRTEIFRYGVTEGSCHHFDVNSLYPSLMVDNLFPKFLERWEFRDEPLELMPSIDPSQSVAIVEINTPEWIFPVKGKERTYYPVGRFTATLAGPELQYAFEQGYIEKWGSWAEYSCKPIFRDFVADLWEQRQRAVDAGDKFIEATVKLLLNALSGKLGQKGNAWELDPDTMAPASCYEWTVINRVSRSRQVYRSVGYNTFKLIDRIEKVNSLPAIPAFLCAYGRQKMNALRAICGADNVYYQAVDSLIVSDLGSYNLHEQEQVEPRQLGKLRLIRSAPRCHLRGCGDYTIGSHTAHSGRTSNAEHLDSGQWEQTIFEATAGMFRPGTRDTVCTFERLLTPPSGYSKGKIGPDNWIEPLMGSAVP